MPRLKGTGRGPSERMNIRLDEETAGFYRSKANEHGISVSEFLRQMLVQGVIAENVQEIEERLRGAVAEIRSAQAPASGAQLPEELLLSLFTSEALLTAIVEARDPRQLYEAQDRAKARLQRYREA